MLAGGLFTEDYLREGVRAAPGYAAAHAAAPELARFVGELFAAVGDPARLNEAQTEDRIIRPLLDRLGWAGLRVVQAAATRADVPDYLLFADAEAFRTADPLPSAEKFRHAAAVGDAKAWAISLDQRGGGAGHNETPAGQVLRYMDRAAQRSARCRLGLLTNGRTWRLYNQDVGDRLTRFFEVDLLAVLHGSEAGVLPLFGLRVEPEHAWALLALFFGRERFGEVQRLALHEGRLWETRVREDLSRVVFDTVYPGLLRALHAAEPTAPLAELQHAALTLLYRLLFALYAEDRDLLPWRDRRFDDYALSPERDRVAVRIDEHQPFSPRSTQLWGRLADLFDIIDNGDAGAGVPPYNGGLFAPPRAPLLGRVRLTDPVLAPLLDALSRREEDGARRRINYRDLSVRELGSIYERLLEHEPVADLAAAGGVAVRLSTFARKGSGSYYTPDVLVKLIIERTLRPLVRERLDAFEQAVADAGDHHDDPLNRRSRLDAADPAAAILALKVCDPAMGSGHFLVDLVDWLAVEAFTAIGGAESKAAALGLDWRSPTATRLEALRAELVRERDAHGWMIPEGQLADSNLIKRLVLKRCVFGVDKNPMAVELAKVALWLHTFTAGAPLSFLDHHLRCGDSLFGEWADAAIREVEQLPAGRGRRTSPFAGAGLFLSAAVQRALTAEAVTARVEASPDAVLAEVEQSEADWKDAAERVRPLQAYLDFRQAARWMTLTPEDATAVSALLDERFGDPLAILAGDADPTPPAELDPAQPEQLDLLPGAANLRDWRAVVRLVGQAQVITGRERFLHWQTAFPGVWRGWRDARTEGFDAVIGNPPWDKIEVDDVSWFRSHDPAFRDRVKVNKDELRDAIDRAEAEATDLWSEFEAAKLVSSLRVKTARGSPAYRVVADGRADIYGLFVARALDLIKPTGVVGLLTPTGVVADKRLAPFFAELSEAGRILATYDFENRRGPEDKRGRPRPFFTDVHNSFRFCAFLAGGPKRVSATSQFAFMRSAASIATLDEDSLNFVPGEFAKFNPNSRTAVFFQSLSDVAVLRAMFTTGVPVKLKSPEKYGVAPLRLIQMINIKTGRNKSFFEKDRLERDGFYLLSGTELARGGERLRRFFVGKSIHQFDHRYAAVVESDDAEENENLGLLTTADQHASPEYIPQGRFWAREDAIAMPGAGEWALAYRDIARVTDVRTAIAAIIPRVGAGHTLPLIISDEKGAERLQAKGEQGLPYSTAATLLLANMNSIPFDFATRLKVQTTHLSWYIIEQLPVVPPTAYARHFGARTAGEIVRDHVLRLSYTAWDLAAFARDMGHVYAEGEPRPDGAAVGNVRPPFRWNEAERRQLRARLDALYFILYGVTDMADVDHVLSTFPIVERHDRQAHGVHLTRELVRWHMRALLAGDAGRDAPEAELVTATRQTA